MAVARRGYRARANPLPILTLTIPLTRTPTLTKVSVERSGSPWLPGGDSFPLAWLALLGLALSAPTQLYLLNTTLASSSVALSVPLYSSLIILLTGEPNPSPDPSPNPKPKP